MNGRRCRGANLPFAPWTKRSATGYSMVAVTIYFYDRMHKAADTALRLSLYFGNSPEFCLNLQSHYDLKMARRNLKPAEAERIKAQKAA